MDWPMEVLPTPGGPTSSRIEPAISPLQRAHGEELDDAFLDVVQAVVVAVENLARTLEVELVLGVNCPTAALVSQSR